MTRNLDKSIMYGFIASSTGLCVTAVAIALLPLTIKADHLPDAQCYSYFECVLGMDSALNRCYDNDYLKENSLTRVMCMKVAQHECKVKSGIQGTGRKMRLSRPFDVHARLTLMDVEAGIVSLVDQDIRIYNYAGWNHCPPQYQGLQDFWCDPLQLRYPPRPWCDVIPTFNVQEPHTPG